MARFTPLIPLQADDETRPPGPDELLQPGAVIGEDPDIVILAYEGDDETRPLGSEELLRLGAEIGDDLDLAILSDEADDYSGALASLEQAERHLRQFGDLIRSHLPSST
jgi:hypothetical protein